MIVERLREETKDQHRRIEESLVVMRPGVTARDVRALLAGFYGFYAPWEQRAGETLSKNGLSHVMDGRWKTPLLEQDLGDATGLPVCGRLPDLSSVLKVLGSMYVLEGSTLGGQVIARHVGQLPELRGGEGCSFFGCYGPRVGVMWREFQGVLRSNSSPAADDEMVASARETFVLLHDWLNDAIPRA